jgi:electron transport complex protein RnfG
MSNKQSTFINMVVTLFVITIVAGVSLGFVNEITLEPKAKAKLAKKVSGLKQVLPTFDNNPVEELKLIKSEKAKDSIEMYPAFNAGEFVGAAVIGSSEKGFSGLVKIMVGFKPNGEIQNIVVLEQKETPGLGTKMKDEKYIQQYRDKNPSEFDLRATKDGGKIDALTGATITTRAFSEATQMAYEEFMKHKEDLTTPKN